MKFVYKARDKSGILHSGEIDAGDSRSVRKQLVSQGLYLVDVQDAATIKTVTPKAAVGKFKKFRASLLAPKVHIEEVLMFYNQIQSTFSVGIPITQGLELIAEQTENAGLRIIVFDIKACVSQGMTFSDALGRHPKVFDYVTVNLIRAGEASGQMETLLDRVSKLAEESYDTRAKLKSAMFYPKMVVGFISVAFTVIVYFLIPKLETFFSRFDGQLPLITRLVLEVSRFFTGYWYLVAAVIFGSVWSFKTFTATPQGARQWDAFKLKLPIYGKLLTMIEMMNFCSVFEVLTASGIPILQALDLIANTMSNILIREDVNKCREFVAKGGSLSDGLKTSVVFPKLVISMVGVGEAGGSLGKVLGKVQAFYKVQVGYKLNNLSKALEPILLVVVFVMVLILALAMFLPLWKMSSLIKK